MFCFLFFFVFLSQVLGDIEIAQGLQRDTEKKEREVHTHILVHLAPRTPSLPPSFSY